MVIADLEAGIGTLTRMRTGSVEAVVIVVEPTAKSLEVGRRAAALAVQKGLGRVLVVANSVRSEDDVTAVRAAFDGQTIVAVPYDGAIIAAERAGRAPLDSTPSSPAVGALVSLVDQLPERAARRG